MLKLRFDDSDYSVVVKNRRGRPDSWRWEIHRAGRSNPVGESPIFFSHHGSCEQGRESGAQAAVGQAQRVALRFQKDQRSALRFSAGVFP